MSKMHRRLENHVHQYNCIKALFNFKISTLLWCSGISHDAPINDASCYREIERPIKASGTSK